MRRQVGIGEGTRAAAGARRRAESGGRADTAGRGGQVGKRGGRLREVGQHPRPMQAAGALSSGVWTGPTVDSGLCCGARVGGRRADEESTRDWQRACVPGGQCDGETLLAVVADPGDVGGGGGAEGGGGRRRGCGSAKGGRWWPCRGATETRCCLLLQWTASSGSSRFWANEQTAGRKFVGAAVSLSNGRGRIRTRGGSSGQSATVGRGRGRRGRGGRDDGGGWTAVWQRQQQHEETRHTEIRNPSCWGGSAGKHGGAGAGVRVRVRVQADNLDRWEVEITPALGVRSVEVVGVDSCLVFGAWAAVVVLSPKGG